MDYFWYNPTLTFSWISSVAAKEEYLNGHTVILTWDHVTSQTSCAVKWEKKNVNKLKNLVLSKGHETTDGAYCHGHYPLLTLNIQPVFHFSAMRRNSGWFYVSATSPNSGWTTRATSTTRASMFSSPLPAQLWHSLRILSIVFRWQFLQAYSCWSKTLNIHIHLAAALWKELKLYFSIHGNDVLFKQRGVIGQMVVSL